MQPEIRRRLKPKPTASPFYTTNASPGCLTITECGFSTRQTTYETCPINPDVSGAESLRTKHSRTELLLLALIPDFLHCAFEPFRVVAYRVPDFLGPLVGPYMVDSIFYPS
jgi:hypothetical protein